MKKKIIFTLMIVVMTTIASADFIVGDSANNMVVERYSEDGTLIWTVTSGRSSSAITLNKSEEIFFLAKQGTDKLLTTVGVDGVYLDDRYKSGTNIVDTEWLSVDLDNDGRVELAVSGRDFLDIVSVDDTIITNVTYTTLASYTVADTIGSNGTGGKLLLGDDYNDDGVDDIISTKGGNDANNRINIWDPTDGSQIASYSATECRGANDMIFGEDQNADGIDDLWVVDVYRSSIRAYDMANAGAYIGVVNLGITLKTPMDICETNDGDVYISTRFASSLSEGDLGSAWANVIKYDPVTDTATLLLDTEGGRWDTIAYYEEPPVVYKEFFVVDGNVANKLYKYNQYGDLLWEADGFRSTKVMKVGPDGQIYCFRASTDKTIEKVNPINGAMTRFYTPEQVTGTNRAYDGEFAYDYNQDGVTDLYALIGNVTSTWTTECTITGYSSLKVISGPGAADEGTVLAQLDNLIASSMTTGSDVATIAEAADPNSPDGVDELYLVRADNGSTKAHAMYVIEPTTLRVVKAYTAQKTAAGLPTATENPSFSITGDNEMKFGPDGYLYVNSQYNDRYARFAVSLVDGDVSIVQSGIGDEYFFADAQKANNPGGFDFYEGKLYSANRFAVRSDIVTSDVYPGDVSMINLGDATLDGVFVSMPGSGRTDDILIMDALECPYDYPADLNGDCLLDGADIAIIAADWLACTDPVVENCN